MNLLVDERSVESESDPATTTCGNPPKAGGSHDSQSAVNSTSFKRLPGTNNKQNISMKPQLSVPKFETPTQTTSTQTRLTQWLQKKQQQRKAQREKSTKRPKSTMATASTPRQRQCENQGTPSGRATSAKPTTRQQQASQQQIGLADTAVFAANEDIQKDQLVVLFLLHRKVDDWEDSVEKFFECLEHVDELQKRLKRKFQVLRDAADSLKQAREALASRRATGSRGRELSKGIDAATIALKSACEGAFLRAETRLSSIGLRTKDRRFPALDKGHLIELAAKLLRTVNSPMQRKGVLGLCKLRNAALNAVNALAVSSRLASGYGHLAICDLTVADNLQSLGAQLDSMNLLVDERSVESDSDPATNTCGNPPKAGGSHDSQSAVNSTSFKRLRRRRLPPKPDSLNGCRGNSKSRKVNDRNPQNGQNQQWQQHQHQDRGSVKIKEPRQEEQHQQRQQRDSSKRRSNK
nr:unnamed protein product [Spirometra erinaceieuropaei]